MALRTGIMPIAVEARQGWPADEDGVIMGEVSRRWATLATTTMALALTACGGGNPDQSASGSASGSASPATSILIWADDAHADAIEAAAASTPSPTISVVVQRMDLTEIRDKIPELAPQGQGPDLFFGQSDWVGELVDGGLLAPVDISARASQLPAGLGGRIHLRLAHLRGARCDREPRPAAQHGTGP